MPKEIIRKRGKRKAKTTEATVEEATEEAYQAQVQGTSTSTSTHDLNAQPHQGGDGEADWVTPGDGGYGSIRERVEGDAPWGFVDAEVSTKRRRRG